MPKRTSARTPVPTPNLYRFELSTKRITAGIYELRLANDLAGYIEQRGGEGWYAELVHAGFCANLGGDSKTEVVEGIQAEWMRRHRTYQEDGRTRAWKEATDPATHARVFARLRDAITGAAA